MRLLPTALIAARLVPCVPSARTAGALSSSPRLSSGTSRSCAWVRGWPATLHSQDSQWVTDPEIGPPTLAARSPVHPIGFEIDAVLLGATLVRRLQERLRAISSNDVIQDAIRREAKRLTIPGSWFPPGVSSWHVSRRRFRSHRIVGETPPLRSQAEHNNCPPSGQCTSSNFGVALCGTALTLSSPNGQR